MRCIFRCQFALDSRVFKLSYEFIWIYKHCSNVYLEETILKYVLIWKGNNAAIQFWH